MVILADPNGRAAPPGIGSRSTLDELFRRAAARRPDAIALMDPPNRKAFTDGAPRRLTYAEADRVVSAMAGRLRQMGLRMDTIVGIQVANSVESVLTLLAVLRAGLIAMPLPLLWRRADMVAALDRVGCNALIVSGRIGAADHFDLAVQVAVEVFSIRCVCGFGPQAPDGVVSFDDLFDAEAPDQVFSIESERALPPGPSAHLAVVTWDVTTEGLVPIGRSHAELIAGGLAVMLESGLAQDAVTLSTITLSSFAGLAVSVLPWLLSGGTLALHHPFDPATFAAQCAATEADTVIVPGALVEQFAAAGHLSGQGSIKSVVGVWRTPERLTRAPRWQHPAVSMTDVQLFGEIGLVATRRGPASGPSAISFGPVPAPRDQQGALIVAEIRRTDRGTVALSGPMVPRIPFPPGVERTTLPSLKVSTDGFVDTGYACQSKDGVILTVTAPPPGLVTVGGYRFRACDLQDAVDGVESGATLAALPDALAGHRLAGAATDHGRMQQALAERGVNALLTDAFRAGEPTITADDQKCA
jgi:hypothetical protein